MGYVEESSPRPLRERMRSSSCFSCCFRGFAGGGEDEGQPPSLLRSSSAWLRREIPELRDRCRGLASSIGRHRRRGSGGEFRYDPLSYALNFDEGDWDGDAEEFRCRNFSARLPTSPPPPLPASAVVGVGSAVY